MVTVKDIQDIEPLIRSSLIECSQQYVKGNIPPDLCAELIRHKIWTWKQVWLFIHEMTDSKRQAKTVTALIPQLTDTQFDAALTATLSINDEVEKCSTLIELAPSLPKTKVGGILADVQDLDETDRVWIISNLAGYLPEDELRNTVNIARNITDNSTKAWILGVMAEYFPNLADDALATAECVTDPLRKSDVLSKIARTVPGAAEKALVSIRLIKGQKLARAQILAALAEVLPEAADDPIFSELLSVGASLLEREDLTSNISYKSTFAEVVIWIPDKYLPELLSHVKKGHGGYVILNTLAERLPGDQLGEVLALVELSNDENSRARVLTTLANRAQDDQLDRILDLSSHLVDEGIQSKVWASLIPHLSDEKLDGLLEKCLTFRDDVAKARGLSSIAERRPELALETLITVNRIPVENIEEKTAIISRLSKCFSKIL